jgi:hypothetical protein
MALSPESQKRYDLIKAIEAERGSKVITYFLGDRQSPQMPLLAQIAEDAVRPIYDHLRALPKASKVDLFLYSVGGLTEVPWRIVTMIREFAEEFSVLVPYKAASAATMIAIGADKIVMGRKGELGPIDPQLQVRRKGEGGTVVQEQIAVEDIISYFRFAREKAGLSDQSALVAPFSALTGKLDQPWILGGINRIHAHIRSVARKLLTARKQPPDEQRIQVIIDSLAEKTYQHGHAIGAKEAEEVGLNVARPSDALEKIMWDLFECYESLTRLREPFDANTYIPDGQDERTDQLVMGCIESVLLSHHFKADLYGRHKRQTPPQLNLTLNLNLQLPPTIQPQQLPAGVQQAAQQLLQQVQQQIQTLIQQELQKQSPIVGFEGRLQGAAWSKMTDWP